MFIPKLYRFSRLFETVFSKDLHAETQRRGELLSYGQLGVFAGILLKTVLRRKLIIFVINSLTGP